MTVSIGRSSSLSILICLCIIQLLMFRHACICIWYVWLRHYKSSVAIETFILYLRLYFSCLLELLPFWARKSRCDSTAPAYKLSTVSIMKHLWLWNASLFKKMFETIFKHVFYIHYLIHIGQESDKGREIKNGRLLVHVPRGNSL